MAQYNIIAENEDYTIVSDYEAIYRKSDKYQSEAQLEKELIKTLTEQGYDYLPIHTEKDLVDSKVVISLLCECLDQLLLQLGFRLVFIALAINRLIVAHNRVVLVFSNDVVCHSLMPFA